MLTRHRWFVLAVGVALAGCQDASRPLGPASTTASVEQAVQVQSTASDLFGDVWFENPAHILRQDAGAPALETYRTSFWVRRDKLTQVTVNYQDGQPFLWFDVPKDGLFQRSNGQPFKGRDSVYITLTIDTLHFVVDFEPSGLVFKKDHAAQLFIWYEHANPDLNRDGVVDATDASLRDSLHIVTRPVKRANWHPAKGGKGQTLPYVFADLRHFSQWAVSW